jgi:hypothetical protein
MALITNQECAMIARKTGVDRCGNFLPTLTYPGMHSISFDAVVSEPYCPGKLLKQFAALPSMVRDDVSECSTTDVHSADTRTSGNSSSRPSSEAGDCHVQALSLEMGTEFPSLGSTGHHHGVCNPCGFAHHTGGCSAGVDCKFCHLCPPGTIEQRRKMKRKLVRTERKSRRSEIP